MARKQTKSAKSAKPITGSVITAIYKKTHVMDKIGEQVSKTVRGGDLNEPVDAGLFAKLCKANQIDPARWSHVNIGMQVMNFTNVLRGRATRKEAVVTSLKERAPRKARAAKAEQAEQIAA
jgi:hypothetical protein